MCEDRRPTIGVTNMEGKEPKRVFSLNLTETKFVLSLLVLVVAFLGILSGGADWMDARADSQCGVRISKELTPPAGSISNAIGDAVNDHTAAARLEAMQAAQDFDQRLQRVEFVVELLYEETTGRKPPAMPGG